MRHIHRHGVIHRDLKPTNILLDDDWRALIADFGWSRSVSATGLPTPHAGTPLYAAPEQREYGVAYSNKVDVYSFGLVLYDIVGNRPVFPTRRSGPLSDVPATFGPYMQGLIRRCWSVDPAGRPSFRDIFDEFVARGFDILPDAHESAIAASVSKVLELEKHLG
jgi:serine/threonine protein kinase